MCPWGADWGCSAVVWSPPPGMLGLEPIGGGLRCRPGSPTACDRLGQPGRSYRGTRGVCCLCWTRRHVDEATPGTGLQAAPPTVWTPRGCCPPRPLQAQPLTGPRAVRSRGEGRPRGVARVGRAVRPPGWCRCWLGGSAEPEAPQQTPRGSPRPVAARLGPTDPGSFPGKRATGGWLLPRQRLWRRGRGGRGASFLWAGGLRAGGFRAGGPHG